MKTLKNTKALTLLSVLAAIEVILSSFTPLGFIPLGGINATTIHIPVIIGAIFLGPVAGGILGGVFGILSVITNTIRPNITSFVFSPFITMSDTSGNFSSLLIAIVPRVMMGVIAYYTYKQVNKVLKNKILAYSCAGIVGSLVNTILVMGGIYIFFGSQYAAAKQIEFSALFGVIMSVICINGVVEAIVAALIVSAVCKVLNQIYKITPN